MRSSDLRRPQLSPGINFGIIEINSPDRGALKGYRAGARRPRACPRPFLVSNITSKSVYFERAHLSSGGAHQISFSEVRFSPPREKWHYKYSGEEPVVFRHLINGNYTRPPDHLAYMAVMGRVRTVQSGWGTSNSPTVGPIGLKV